MNGTSAGHGFDTHWTYTHTQLSHKAVRNMQHQQKYQSYLFPPYLITRLQIQRAVKTTRTCKLVPNLKHTICTFRETGVWLMHNRPLNSIFFPTRMKELKIWIILNNWVRISGKRLKILFAIWVAQVKCQLVPLYSGEGWHLYISHWSSHQNLPSIHPSSLLLWDHAEVAAG